LFVKGGGHGLQFVFEKAGQKITVNRHEGTSGVISRSHRMKEARKGGPIGEKKFQVKQRHCGRTRKAGTNDGVLRGTLKEKGLKG